MHAHLLAALESLPESYPYFSYNLYRTHHTPHDVPLDCFLHCREMLLKNEHLPTQIIFGVKDVPLRQLSNVQVVDGAQEKQRFDEFALYRPPVFAQS